MTEEEELAALHEWDDERGGKESPSQDLSDLSMLYLSQIKELQKQYELERIQLQRLEMSIRGFHAALKEELEKGLQAPFLCYIIQKLSSKTMCLHSNRTSLHHRAQQLEQSIDSYLRLVTNLLVENIKFTSGVIGVHNNIF